MISLLKNIIVGIVLTLLSANCQLQDDVNNDFEEFVGSWKLYKLVKIDDKANEIEILAPADNKNKIIANEDNTFSAVLSFINSNNNNIIGTWERIDKTTVSLKPNQTKKEEHEIMILYRDDFYYVLKYNSYYKNDSIVKFKFKKQ